MMKPPRQPGSTNSCAFAVRAATDPTIPHQAYNGHVTTFKAIARGGDGNYVVEWDPEGDGTYRPSFTSTNRHNLSCLLIKRHNRGLSKHDTLTAQIHERVCSS